MEQYKNAVREQSTQAKLSTTKTSNMETYFLNLATTIHHKVNRKYLAGATFTKADDKVIAWFNGQPLHTVPLTLNLVHNAIVGPNNSIHLKNHPFKNWTINPGTKSGQGYVGLALFLGISLSFVAACYIIAYIKANLNPP